MDAVWTDAVCVRATHGLKCYLGDVGSGSGLMSLDGQYATFGASSCRSTGGCLLPCCTLGLCSMNRCSFGCMGSGRRHRNLFSTRVSVMSCSGEVLCGGWCWCGAGGWCWCGGRGMPLLMKHPVSVHLCAWASDACPSDMLGFQLVCRSVCRQDAPWDRAGLGPNAHCLLGLGANPCVCTA